MDRPSKARLRRIRILNPTGSTSVQNQWIGRSPCPVPKSVRRTAMDKIDRFLPYANRQGSRLRGVCGQVVSGSSRSISLLIKSVRSPWCQTSSILKAQGLVVTINIESLREHWPPCNHDTWVECTKKGWRVIRTWALRTAIWQAGTSISDESQKAQAVCGWSVVKIQPCARQFSWGLETPVTFCSPS